MPEQPTHDLLQTVDQLPASPARAPEIPGYRITAEIARGGMGMVYAAHDLTLDREVAIKTLLLGLNPERFVTESKITARLTHPGIPPVYALGTLNDGSHFLVMKLIHGRTLSELLKERTSPTDDLSRFVQVFEQIAQAVGFAHSRGIIHRDLKPLNVMVGEFGEVQVMDWGLAKDTTAHESPGSESEASPADAQLTQAGAVMGTPGYMAPEQARGEPVDARADVFALGSILGTILTNRPAFVGTTVHEAIAKAANADLADVKARLETCGADKDLIAIAWRCLSANRVDRPGDARDVAAEVAAYRAGVEARLRQAETEATEATVRATETRKRQRVLVMAAGFIAAALLAGIIGTSLGLREAEAKRQEAVREKQTANEALVASLLTQAEAIRRQGGLGQRTRSLKALREAVTVSRDAELLNDLEHQRRFRDHFLSTFILPDLEIARDLPIPAQGYTGAMYMSADFNRLAITDTTNTVLVLNTETNQILAQFPHDPAVEVEPVLSSDGKFLAIRKKTGETAVWSLNDLNEPKIIGQGLSSHPNAIAFSQDSSVLALATRARIQIVELEQFQVIATLEAPQNATAFVLEWCSDNRHLAACWYGSPDATVFDTRAKQQVATFRHPRTAYSVSWHPDRKVLGVGCQDGNCHFWDLATKTKISSLAAHASLGIDMRFSPHGTAFVTRAWNGEMAVRSAPVGADISRRQMGRSFRLTFSADGHEVGPELLGNCLRTWRIIPEQELRTYVLETHHDDAQPAFHPTHNWLICSNTRDGVLVWDLATGKLLDRLPEKRFERLIAVSPSVILALHAGTQGNMPTTISRIPIHPEKGLLGVPRPLLQVPTNGIHQIDYSPQTRVLAVASGTGAALWTLKDNEYEAKEEEWPQPTTRNEPDKKTGRAPSAVSARPPDQFIARDDLRYLSISPDGRWLAGGTHFYRDVSVWELPSAKEAAKLPSSAWTFQRFSASGKWLATHDGRSRLWRTGDWTEGPSTTPSNRPRSIATTISPNDEVIFSADEGNWLRIISTRSGQELARIELTANIHRLDCSPDGRFLAILSTYGRLFVLDWQLLRQRVDGEGVRWELPLGE